MEFANFAICVSLGLMGHQSMQKCHQRLYVFILEYQDMCSAPLPGGALNRKEFFLGRNALIRRGCGKSNNHSIFFLRMESQDELSQLISGPDFNFL